MNKVKILLSEEPKMECECPFCTSAGCVLTAYDSSYGEKVRWISANVMERFEMQLDML